MNAIRTFVSVPIVAHSRKLIVRLTSSLSYKTDRVRWTASDKLHLTLAFLGDVDPSLIGPICKTVSTEADKLPAFEASLKGLGAFPSMHRPRIIWVGVGVGREKLVELAARVENAISEFGLRRENRPFRPHLTIGRVREGRSPGDLSSHLEKHADFDGGAWTISEIHTMSSTLSRAGAEHAILATHPLGG